MWATTVTYGHLQRTVVTAPGTGTCTMVALPCTGTTAVSETGFQFVVLGIKIVDYLSIRRWADGQKPVCLFIPLKSGSEILRMVGKSSQGSVTLRPDKNFVVRSTPQEYSLLFMI